MYCKHKTTKNGIIKTKSNKEVKKETKQYVI